MNKDNNVLQKLLKLAREQPATINGLYKSLVFTSLAYWLGLEIQGKVLADLKQIISMVSRGDGTSNFTYAGGILTNVGRCV